MSLSSYIECKNLAIGYESPLVSNLSFSVEKGEILLVNGRNGSGKSTLIKTILGHIKELKGSVALNLSADEISYLPQFLDINGHFSYTVEEILNYYDVSEENKEFAKNTLSLNWSETSGGQKQKTLILSRLSEKTKLLILDEPFNHLDQQAILDLVSLFNYLLEKSIAIILVSHQKDKIKILPNLKEVSL